MTRRVVLLRYVHSHLRHFLFPSRLGVQNVQHSPPGCMTINENVNRRCREAADDVAVNGATLDSNDSLTPASAADSPAISATSVHAGGYENSVGYRETNAASGAEHGALTAVGHQRPRDG
ncbi:hypothetical protein ISCGN_005614 [Ixodes scapularis]